MNISEKLPILRKRKGYSQEELAHQLDVSRQAVYKWEVGESMPELDKIKKIATLFEISFDDLLDDTVDITKISGEKPKKKKAKYRKVFVSGKEYDFDFSDEEHGFFSKKKHSLENAKLFYKAKEEKLEKFLDENKFKDTYKIQDDSTLTYFYDDKNKSFGFYFGDNVQFVCPIENLIDVEVNSFGGGMGYTKAPVFGLGVGGGLSVGVGSMPLPEEQLPTGYDIQISYFDEQGEYNKYNLCVNCLKEYAIHQIKKTEEHWDWLKFSTSARLKGLVSKFKEIKVRAEKLKEEEIKVEELDFEPFNKALEQAKNEEQELVQILEGEIKKKKIAKLIKIAIAIIAVGTFLIVFW